MLNSLFPFKLTEDNITYVLEYMKNNIADYDMTNIRYEINANNDYVVKFDKYEMTLSKDLTVGETIYTINNSFNLNSSPSSSYNQPKSSASNQLESNISIDLEMYTKIIDELNNCKIELDSFLPNKSESSYFDGELLSYYNSNYKKTVATEWDTIKNNKFKPVAPPIKSKATALNFSISTIGMTVKIICIPIREPFQLIRMLLNSLLR